MAGIGSHPDYSRDPRYTRLKPGTGRITPHKPTCEAMVDIETLATSANAVIFQFAVVLFNTPEQTETGVVDKHSTILYKKLIDLDVQEQLNLGREVSASTLRFHLNIPGNLLNSMDDEDQLDLSYLFAFLQDTKFKNEYDITAWWSKGDFDYKLLESLARDHEERVTLPWSFRNKRELRTLMKECGVPKGLVSHNALEDCLGQIDQLAECRKRIHA